MAKGNVSPLAKRCKADYEKLGRLHARTGAAKVPFPRDASSWQAKAYWAAYDADKAEEEKTREAFGTGEEDTAQAEEFFGVMDKQIGRIAEAAGLSKEELVGQQKPAKISAVVKVTTNLQPSGVFDLGLLFGMDLSELPPGAREHVRVLRVAVLKETKPQRKQRLKAAITRIALRHTPTVKAAS